MDDNRKIHLVSLSSSIVEDEFDEGLGESTGCGLQNEAIGKTFESMAAAVKYLASNYGLSDAVVDYDIENESMETERACANHSEAQNGGWFDPTEDEIEKWQKGEMKLYSEQFTIKFIYAY